MLSGIGPGAQLRDKGIEVLADRPGVGENLQDHLELYLQMECKQPITLYKHLNLFSKAWIGAQWLFFKKGHGTTNHFESAAFIRSKAGVKYPDIQYHFLPVAIRYDGKAAAKAHGFQAHVGPMRSGSRRAIRFRTTPPSTISSAMRWKAPITPAAPAAWVPRTIRMPLWTSTAGSSGSKGSTSPTVPFSRRSPMAT